VPPGSYPRNVAVQWELRDALVAGQTIVKDGSKDQPLSVAQPMRNIRDHSIEIQYQYDFLNANGAPFRTVAAGGTLRWNRASSVSSKAPPSTPTRSTGG
jgi:hypothetical protein